MLTDLQELLVRALTSNAPLETLRSGTPELSAAGRALVEAIDPERFLLSSFLVRKLRFEQICRGDTTAEAWFARDPESFTRAFRAYNAKIPPFEIFPSLEAQAFRDWCRANGVPQVPP